MPWAMTAHILYAALDDKNPATLSQRLIADVIRASIGFDGVLVSDDLSMAALPGRLGGRAAGAIAAGCDVALHCNGAFAEMMEIAAAVGPLSPAALARIERGEARRRIVEPFDRVEGERRFAALMAGEG